MKRKHKMTGCARLFLVIIILAPLAYLGASYATGENGIENIKNLLGIGVDKPNQSSSDTYQDTAKDLERQIKALERENRQLKDELEEKEDEIKRLKSGGQ